MDNVPLEQLTCELFAGLLNTRFRLWVTEEDSLELELRHATPVKLGAQPGVKPAALESFSLVFLGPASPVLPQRTYPFESAGLGRFDLFIVPIGRDQSGVSYEATFTRLSSRAG